MKHCVLLFAFSFLLISSLASADPGVIIDVKGKVTLNGAPVKAGAKFADGAKIGVPKGGSAQLMFTSGAMKKLSGGDNFTAASGSAASSGDRPLINGITMALNDASTRSKGPVVHGMVKELGGPKKAPPQGDKKLSPSSSKEMALDLSRINTLGLSPDGKAIMQAQVYYKYGQYQKQVNALLPVHKRQTPPSETVTSLIVLGYERMGKMDEADRFRN